MKYGDLSAFLIILIITGCTSLQGKSDSQDIKSTVNLVDPDELISGGPPKDGIPSIDSPIFVSVDESDWLVDSAQVFVIIGERETKVYPQPILVWHEIVNDIIDDIPVAVTYCPLCGSSIAYKRVVNGEITTFGTTGKLYNSNLVMYDRLTDSYWSQIRGEAIIGILSGKRLEKVSLQTVLWKEAKDTFQDALVLSRETGYLRDYGSDPYTGYYSSDNIIFPVENIDSRIHPKAIVIGIEIGNESKAYPDFEVRKQKKIIDRIGGTIIELELTNEGFINVTDVKSNKRILWERDFWFAWAAFHPETELYLSGNVSK